jgi:hypothetical protein
MPKTANCEPTRPKLLKDIDDPMCVCDMIETRDPSRAKLRRDKEEPRVKAPQRDSEAPLPTPQTEKRDPRRTTARIDKVEPKAAKSNRDIVEPTRV